MLTPQAQDANTPLPQGYTRNPDGSVSDRNGRPVDPAIANSYLKLRGQLPVTYQGNQQQPQGNALGTPSSAPYRQVQEA